MSNLLNAIELSEQSHSAQSHSAHNQTTSRHSAAAYQPANLSMVSSLRVTRQPRRLPTWLLPTLIVALPVAGAIAYTQLMPATQTLSPSPALAPASATVTSLERNTVPAAVPVIADKIPGVEFLPYPYLVTEPLAVGDVSYAVTPGHADDQDSRSYQTEAVTDSGRNGRSSGMVADTASNNTRSDNWELDDLDLSELSPELARQLKSAIAATESEPQQGVESVNESATSNGVKAPAAISIADLPASVQNRMPKLDFQTHIYSSTANSRWVKVNGREAFEGDELASGVILRRIEPRQVVFDFESYHIVMPALSEW
ncbi:general secretion pathway protein GspB [Pseudomonadota bacterium]